MTSNDQITAYPYSEQARSDFLSACGWENAFLSPIGEDCAFRRYFRLTQRGHTAVLMEAVPDDSAMASPGHRIGDFMRIGKYLRRLGLHTPEVIAADAASGYALLEDFGDTSFRLAMERGGDASALYELAVDVLAFLRENARPGSIELPEYRESHVHDGRRFVVDWYMPVLLGDAMQPGLAEDYLSVWDEIESGLPPCPQGFLHIDFHVENLMVVEGAQGLARCGILDFQGAMWGPAPYDLANLLEDARRRMPDDLRAALLDRYCKGMSAEEAEVFKSWYRVLATQFHCRVIGQFIKLAKTAGKKRYLAHLPRLAGYIDEALKDPLLAPLAGWFSEQGVFFNDVPDPSRLISA